MRAVYLLTATAALSVALLIHMQVSDTVIAAVGVLYMGILVGVALGLNFPHRQTQVQAESESAASRIVGLAQQLAVATEEESRPGGQGLLGLDDRSSIVFADERASACLGYPPEELLGLALEKLVAGRGREGQEGQILCKLGAGIPAWGQDRLRTKQGEVRSLGFVVSPAYDNGQVHGSLLLLHNTVSAQRLETGVEQATAVFQNTVEGIIIANAQGEILSVNPAFTDITGYAEEEVIGKNPRILSSGKQDVAFYQEMWRRVREDGRWRGEIQNRHKDGHLYAELLTISVVKDDGGDVRNYVGVFHDISDIKEAQSELLHLAHHDPLTGLPNRVLFDDRLVTAIKAANRHARRVGVLFLDLDGFKTVNDSLGHPVGDELLKQVAERLKNCMREMDTLARLGGDEFIVILERIDSAEDVSVVARKLLASLGSVFHLDGRSISISASIGVSLYPDDGIDAATLTKNADAAMYRAKETGRDNFVFYSSGLTDSALEKIRIGADLALALTENQLRIVYQPHIVLQPSGGRIAAVEALVRWRHPELGELSPERFIPIAEENHRILEMGEWILETACRDMAALSRGGYKDLRLAVNLSAVQVRQRHLVEEVRRILHASDVNPEVLELELTENTIMQQPEMAIRALHRLRALGIRLSIDNFGTGASSMGFLKKLPLDRLKIDGSFLRDVPRDRENVAICHAIVALAHNMGLAVTAEGVESPMQLEFAKELRCDEAQGYHIGPPMPLSELLVLLQQEQKSSEPIADFPSSA